VASDCEYEEDGRVDEMTGDSLGGGGSEKTSSPLRGAAVGNAACQAAMSCVCEGTSYAEEASGER
jgi:hypothetical protein